MSDNRLNKPAVGINVDAGEIRKPSSKKGSSKIPLNVQICAIAGAIFIAVGAYIMASGGLTAFLNHVLAKNEVHQQGKREDWEKLLKQINEIEDQKQQEEFDEYNIGGK